jgi:hypothetical protein
MSNWFYEPSTEDLRAISNAQAEFREVWHRMNRPPFDAQFDGSVKDVNAIDYLQYEGFKFPDSGLTGVALICGEVLRIAAGMRWMIDYRGDWLLVPEFGTAINPLSRLLEMECTGIPQFGRCSRFVSRAALELLEFTSDSLAPIQQLVALDEYSATTVARALSTARNGKSCEK